jgi:hypothetical protein
MAKFYFENNAGRVSEWEFNETDGFAVERDFKRECTGVNGKIF